MEVVNLSTGKQKYFGQIIEVLEIPTKPALCYKIEFLKKSPNFSMHLLLRQTGNLDQFESVTLVVATENTWQGLINGWPYFNSPLKVNATFRPGYSNQYMITMEENVWQYLKVPFLYLHILTEAPFI